MSDIWHSISEGRIECAGEPLPSAERKKWFRRKGPAARLQVSTSHIYTFHLWQHQLNLGAFEIELFVSFCLPSSILYIHHIAFDTYLPFLTFC